MLIKIHKKKIGVRWTSNAYTHLNQNKAQNEKTFVTLEKISEQATGKAIEKGFQLQAEIIISLKKYYKSREEFSLFQWKSFRIKYESIRRTKLQCKYLKRKSRSLNIYTKALVPRDTTIINFPSEFGVDVGSFRAGVVSHKIVSGYRDKMDK